MLECADGSFYTGYTINPKRRLKTHNDKKASKYTRSRVPVRYVFLKAFKNKGQALSYEIKMKRLNRKNKEKLISGNLDDFFI